MFLTPSSYFIKERIFIEEIWKDVKGLEDIAMVSNLGRIKTKDRYVNNNGTLVLRKGIEKKPFINGNGYYQVTLNKEGIKYQPYLHKLVAEAFIDNFHNLKEVNHIDHNKFNCKVENLEWCTRKENMVKMCEFYGIKKEIYRCVKKNCNVEITHGAKRCSSCIKKHKRKVERPDKKELKELIFNLSFVKIGEKFGVSDNTVRAWCKYYELPYRKKDLII